MRRTPFRLICTRPRRSARKARSAFSSTMPWRRNTRAPPSPPSTFSTRNSSATHGLRLPGAAIGDENVERLGELAEALHGQAQIDQGDHLGLLAGVDVDDELGQRLE